MNFISEKHTWCQFLFVGIGIENADFVFYISAMETERCQKGMTVAYAAHCQQESALDRPIAGHANLCPSSIR
jgi:leishmanolysin-like peptidase